MLEDRGYEQDHPRNTRHQHSVSVILIAPHGDDFKGSQNHLA